MSSFGEVLKQCIEDQGISVNGFARDTGINRGWLYNIFTGVKKLPEDKFQALLRDISFTSANEDLLREAFYREAFGDDKYENIIYIADFFNKTFVESCAQKPEKADLYSRPAAHVLPVEPKSFKNALHSIIYEEIKSGEAPVIYTNFPYSLKHVDNRIYNALRACGKPVVLHHLVYFERKSHSKNNLRSVLQSLRYIQLRQNVHYIYADSVSAAFTGTLYPYFVITATGALMFNAVGTRGLLIHSEPAVLAHLCDQANGLIMKCAPLAAFPANLLEAKAINEPMVATAVTSYLVHAPCWTQFADNELLDKAIHPTFPLRESIIQIADRYYADIMRGNPLHFFTLSGIIDFIHNGRFYDAPELLVPPFSPALRVYVLEKMIKYLKEPRDYFFLLDESKITCPDSLAVTFCEGGVMILSKAIIDDDAFVGQCVVKLEDKSIAADFRNCQDYIVRNGFVHTKDYALRSLSDLLVLCKELAAESESE